LFDASLVVYIKITNISTIMIINWIDENKNLVAVACFRPGRAKDLSAPLYVCICICVYIYMYIYIYI
jgi:hypothetical protein